MNMAQPKKKPSKSNLERLAMRVPEQLKAKYERAASLQGETLSGWAKNVLAEAADKQLRDHEFLEMAYQDRLAFAEAVLSPPEPTKANLEAAKRYKKAFGIQ
jgi:uncharacterized protein (DUF1778 family)